MATKQTKTVGGGMVPQKVAPGDPLPAEEYNRLTDEATQMYRSTVGRGVSAAVTSEGISILGQKPLNFPAPAIPISAYNVGSADLSVFDVCQITVPLQEQSSPPTNWGQPVKDAEVYTRQVLEIQTPDAGHFGRFGVCAQKIPSGKAGRIWVSGVCLCRVILTWNYAASQDYRKPDRADTIRGQTYLGMNEIGTAQVLWIEEPLSEDESNVPRPAIIRFDHRQTTPLGITERGNLYNDGFCEVLEFTDSVTVSFVAPGIVKLERA